MSISEIFEGLTTVGLFISVILVFIELRRNGTSTRLNNNLIFTERHFNFRNLTMQMSSYAAAKGLINLMKQKNYYLQIIF